MGDDQELWEAIVDADRRLVAARAEFYRHAQARRETLSAALRGSAWECGAALAFLEALPDEVPELLEQLVEHATAPRWALAARRAIASGPPEAVTPLLRAIVRRRLATAGADDYRRLAELLRHLRDEEALAALVQRAGVHEDPEVREVAQDFTPR